MIEVYLINKQVSLFPYVEMAWMDFEKCFVLHTVFRVLIFTSLKTCGFCINRLDDSQSAVNKI